jgi:hypothetical protein
VLCAEDDTKEKVKPVFDMYDDRKILYDSCTSEKSDDAKRRKATQQVILERAQEFIDKESKNQHNNFNVENAEIFQILKSQNEILRGHAEMLKGFRNSLLSIERRLDVPYGQAAQVGIGAGATEIEQRKIKDEST